MRSFLLAFVLITCCFLRAKSQDTVKKIHHYPTVYGAVGFGSTIVANGTVEAAIVGFWDLNYQYKRNLFTLREVYITTSREPRKGDPAYGLINLPIITGDITEYALLYGWRFVNDRGRGLSFSAGLSTNKNLSYYAGNNSTQTAYIRRYYAGMPFEVNYGWYARRFGPSFGFKLTGDISKYSFVGIGIDVGLGLHDTHKY